MGIESGIWLPCSTCKGDLGFDEVYYLCSVSTCQRGSTNLRFCSIDCWEAHVPTMRHRDAWAAEARTPTAEAWARENPEPTPGNGAARAGQTRRERASRIGWRAPPLRSRHPEGHARRGLEAQGLRSRTNWDEHFGWGGDRPVESSPPGLRRRHPQCLPRGPKDRHGPRLPVLVALVKCKGPFHCRPPAMSWVKGNRLRSLGSFDAGGCRAAATKVLPPAAVRTRIPVVLLDRQLIRNESPKADFRRVGQPLPVRSVRIAPEPVSPKPGRGNP